MIVAFSNTFFKEVLQVPWKMISLVIKKIRTFNGWSMEAPLSMSSRQVSRWPFCAATYSGVTPFCMNTNTASNNDDRKVFIFCETELVWTFQHRRLILSSVLIWPLKIFKLFTCWYAVLLRWIWPVVICLSYTWQDTCSVNPLFISGMSLQFSQTGRFVCFELLFFYYYKHIFSNG